LRILLINHEFTITGSSTTFFRLAMHLQAQEHRISLLSVNPADGPIKARYLAQGVPILDKAVLAGFDLVIANTIASAPFVIQTGPHIPTIWFVNEAEVALRLLLKNPAWLPAFDHAAAVIYNMPFQHDVLRSFTYHLNQAKFHTNSYGVDVDPATIARSAVPAKQAAMRVVQVGTIEPRKRPGDLIQAVARTGLDIECIICGKFFELDATAQAIVEREPEKYRLIEGLTDGEILAWMESADVFCLASSSETQALAAYEAALLARPLLLSDLACYRDVFLHGRNCLMFPAGHIDMLAMSLNMYFSNREFRDEMGSAVQRTAARYSNAAFFARFQAIMQTVVGHIVDAPTPPAQIVTVNDGLG
jgi:glycosyltransferase involved in cell wall biosynthesis